MRCSSLSSGSEALKSHALHLKLRCSFSEPGKIGRSWCVKLVLNFFCAARAPAQYGRRASGRRLEVTSASGSSSMVGADTARIMSGTLLDGPRVGSGPGGVKWCSCLGHVVSCGSVCGKEFGLGVPNGCVCGSKSRVRDDEDGVLLAGSGSCGSSWMVEGRVSRPSSWSIL